MRWRWCSAPRFVSAVAGPLGAGSTAISIWNIAKRSVLALLMVLMVTVLVYASPNVKLRGTRRGMPGAACALVVCLVASVALAFYVAKLAPRPTARSGSGLRS